MTLISVSVFMFLYLAAAEVFEEKIVQEIIRETVVESHVQKTSLSDELKQNWNESKLEKGLEFATGIVSQKCLQCICQTESGCKPIGCKVDVGSLSCGYFQIKQSYWIDCGSLGGDWKKCANDITCSSQCVQNYMNRFATYYKCPLNCEGFAREHNGGPNGCHSPNTWKYWVNLQKQKGCHGVQTP